DEPGVVRAAVQEHHRLVAVVEGHLAIEALLGLRPPRALLGAGRVARCGLLGLEPHHADERVVVGDAVRPTEPALCRRSHLLAPHIYLPVQCVRVAAGALNDLDKHLVSLRFGDRFTLKWSTDRRYAAPWWLSSGPVSSPPWPVLPM